MPTFPTTPTPTEVLADEIALEAVQVERGRLIRHTRTTAETRVRRVRLRYGRLSRAGVDIFLAFYDQIRGRSSRFDFTHPLTAAVYKAKVVEEEIVFRQIRTTNDYAIDELTVIEAP